MDVIYNNKKIEDNTFLRVSETQIEPKIKLNVNSNDLYTIILYDPDAIGGTYIHWTKVNITNNDINTGDNLISYKGPAPPVKSGKHHYIFELYKQNGENKLEPINKKVFEMNVFRKKIGLNNPIYKIQFISENESGGRKRKNTMRRNKKIKNKKTIRKRY